MSSELEKDVERERLSAENSELRRQIEDLLRRVGELEALLRKLGGGSPTQRLDQAYSLKAEEQRQAVVAAGGKKKRRRQKSRRRGRIATQEKLDRAERIELVFPQGFMREDCKLIRRRPAWRIENGRAVLVAYELYRGPDGAVPKVPGLLSRCEFGLEILITLAHQTQIVGLSIDKVLAELQYFWGLTLSKSQADALLTRLSREWHSEFDQLCQLLAVSAVVRTDETSWSIHSVWTFLSEQSRLLIFGCHKDAATLATLLPKETFGGVLVSDDAAVYRGFSQAQKCWAHLLRKAIKLTLLKPQSARYRNFLDGLLALYREACRAAVDQRLGAEGRQRRIDQLELQLCDLCAARVADTTPPPSNVERDFCNLAHELVRLMGAEELFTFVRVPAVPGTNNESERTLRNPARNRRTDQTSRSLRGARRRTILTSVLESLRTRLPVFDLRSVLAEVSDWFQSGVSCFGRTLQKLRLPALDHSPLDDLVPLVNSP
jgi:transposase